VQGSALGFLILAYIAALAVSSWRGVPPQTLHHLGRRRGRAAVADRAGHAAVEPALPAREVLGRDAALATAGIKVTAEQLAFAEKVKRWTLVTSLGVHVISAAVALAIAAFTDAPLGYPFAGFYLLSCLVRPATASISRSAAASSTSPRTPASRATTC
jgi:hypothetical protein